MKHFTTLATLGLGLCIAAAATVSPAAAPKAAPHSKMAMIAQGKSIASAQGCTGCHGSNLGGKQGFSPSIRASGILREYNAKTFARVMDTGITNDGGHVKKPMPVYHLKTAQSAPLYAYLKTLK